MLELLQLINLIAVKVLESTKTSPANIFACKFKFDATFDDGYGGGASDPAPITIIGNSILCKNDSTILKAPYAYSYFWSTGDTSRTIVVKKAGTYYVTVSDNLNNSSTFRSHCNFSIRNSNKQYFNR